MLVSSSPGTTVMCTVMSPQHTKGPYIKTTCAIIQALSRHWNWLGQPPIWTTAGHYVQRQISSIYQHRTSAFINQAIGLQQHNKTRLNISLQKTRILCCLYLSRPSQHTSALTGSQDTWTTFNVQNNLFNPGHQQLHFEGSWGSHKSKPPTHQLCRGFSPNQICHNGEPTAGRGGGEHNHFIHHCLLP